MKLHTVFALLALAGMLSVGPLAGRAQYHSYMTLTGKSDGALKARGGSSGNLTSVVDVSAIMGITRKDAGSSGHGPIKVTKEVDPASPYLLQMHTTSEALPQISFMLYKPGDNSKWKVVTFDNAVITGLTVKKVAKNPNGDPGRGKANQKPAPASTPAPAAGSVDTSGLEEVSFTFQKISVVYYSGGNVSATDDWTSPNQ
jgi:type VI secretion system Hcp family effector